VVNEKENHEVKVHAKWELYEPPILIFGNPAFAHKVSLCVLYMG